jgi:hypothetical protein
VFSLAIGERKSHYEFLKAGALRLQLRIH